MTTKIDVVKFTFRKEWRALTDALAQKYDSEEFSTAADLVTYLSTQTASLVFASLAEKDDLVQLATLVKIAKKSAKDAIVKIVVVNFSGNKQFEKAIGKLGILDVVDPSINTKALRFKIDFYMKSLNGQVKNSANKAALNVKSIDQNKAQEQKRTDAANWLPPMECEDDIWLLKKDTDCKKVLGRWLLRFTAPSPAVCSWADIKGKSNAWKLEFKGDDKDLFVGGTGNWYFQGDQKPEFVWKENSWLVTGSNFELFYHDNGVKQTRAKLKDKILEVCKNSMYAQTKESAIADSCNKELIFKKEADNLKDKAGVDGENGTDKLGNLEGKGSTDHLDMGPLEGENDPSADQINGGPMSGKGGPSDDLGGNYEGDSSTDKLDNSGLEGPAGDKHNSGAELGLDNKNQEHKTKYKGHNEAEEFDAKDDMFGPGSEKHREGELLGMKNDKQEHKTKYKGHNEAEVFEEGELGKHKYDEKTSGPIGGKSNTDHIPKFYNNDGTKPDRALTPEEQAESNAYEKAKAEKAKAKARAQEENEDQDNSQASQAAKKKKALNNDEPEFDEDMGDPYDGKSSTDKLKSHYGGKSQSKADAGFEEEEDDSDSTSSGAAASGKGGSKSKKERHLSKEDDDFSDQSDEERLEELSGSTSTDKLKTHYGGGKKASKAVTEDDLFADEEEDSSYESGPTKKKARVDYDSVDGEPEKDDVFSRAIEKKVKIPEAENVEDVENEQVEEDIYQRKERKNKDRGESAMEDNFYENVAKEKRRRGGHRDEPEKDEFSEAPDAEGDNVVSLARAREAKAKKAPPPLVAEAEIDADLKTMMEEASITALLKQNEIELKCVLDDFFEKTLIFIANQGGFNTVDPVKLDLQFKYMKKVTTLKFDGKILSIDPMDESVNYLTLEIPEANAQAFSAFMKLYQQRQGNIDAFLQKAKGL